MRAWNTTPAHQQRSDKPAELPVRPTTAAVWNSSFRLVGAQGGTCTLTTTMEDMVAKVVAGHHRRLWVVVRATQRAQFAATRPSVSLTQSRPDRTMRACRLA